MNTAVAPELNSFTEVKAAIESSLNRSGVAILPPQDVMQTLELMRLLSLEFDATMLDPWYNKGFGGTQEDYIPFFLQAIQQAGLLSRHVFFWGFPEIVAPFVERIPAPLKLTCWLTWYYKNNPSVIRGWRSSQNACLHMSREGATLYPERFLNEKQLELKRQGKLRYMPGPTSVLEDVPLDVMEESLLVGFVGRKEQTGHPAQKPVKVYDQLLMMTTSDGGLILDPMCGSGTAGAVAVKRNYRVILCDSSEEYTNIVETRLGIERLPIAQAIADILTEKNR
jgi:site-specific DNA-methyltransferase (adenine-specific)